MIVLIINGFVCARPYFFPFDLLYRFFPVGNHLRFGYLYVRVSSCLLVRLVITELFNYNMLTLKLLINSLQTLDRRSPNISNWVIAKGNFDHFSFPSNNIYSDKLCKPSLNKFKVWFGFTENRFSSPGFICCSRQARGKMILMMFHAKKGFVVYYFCMFSLGWTASSIRGPFVLFSSKIEFYNLICIFNRARLVKLSNVCREI